MRNLWANKTFIWTLTSIAALGCTTTGTGDDNLPPKVRLTSPEPGLILDTNQVLVTGSAIDDFDEYAIVDVNGVPAQVDRQGRFSVMVPLTPGATILTATARDSDGREDYESRTVISGDFADSQSIVRNAVVLGFNQQTFQAIAEIAEYELATIDLVEHISNPVVFEENSPCDSRSNVASIAYTQPQAAFASATGGIDFTLVFNNAVVHGHHRSSTCVGTDFIATADVVRIEGRIGVRIVDEALEITIDHYDIETVALDVDGSVVVETFEAQAKRAFLDALDSAVHSHTPKMVNRVLEEFVSSQTLMLGNGDPFEIAFEPAHAEFTGHSGRIVLDSRIAFGFNPYGYFTAPSLPPQTIPSTTGSALQLGLAADLFNQALSGLWAGGFLNKNYDINVDLESVFGFDIDRIDTVAPLMPVVSHDPDTGKLSLIIGDLALRMRERGTGRVVIDATVSLRADINAAADSQGALSLQLEQREFSFDVHEVVPGAPLLADKVEEIGRAIGPSFIEQIRTGLGTVQPPLPAELTVQTPDVASAGSYFVITGDLVGP